MGLFFKKQKLDRNGLYSLLVIIQKDLEKIEGRHLKVSSDYARVRDGMKEVNEILKNEVTYNKGFLKIKPFITQLATDIENLKRGLEEVKKTRKINYDKLLKMIQDLKED